MDKSTRKDLVAGIERLIDAGGGEPGRLYHLLESVKNQKQLYRSDIAYLEAKLRVQITAKQDATEEKEGTESLVVQTGRLAEQGVGDPGRLEHILACLQNNRPLYRSDRAYLEAKLGIPVNVPTIQKTGPVVRASRGHGSGAPRRQPAKAAHYGSLSEEGAYMESPPVATGRDAEEALAEQRRVASEIESQRSRLTQLILDRQEVRGHHP